MDLAQHVFPTAKLVALQLEIVRLVMLVSSLVVKIAMPVLQVLFLTELHLARTAVLPVLAAAKQTELAMVVSQETNSAMVPATLAPRELSQLEESSSVRAVTLTVSTAATPTEFAASAPRDLNPRTRTVLLAQATPFPADQPAVQPVVHLVLLAATLTDLVSPAALDLKSTALSARPAPLPPSTLTEQVPA